MKKSEDSLTNCGFIQNHQGNLYRTFLLVGMQEETGGGEKGAEEKGETGGVRI